jgi:hypothetical protein
LSHRAELTAPQRTAPAVGYPSYFNLALESDVGPLERGTVRSGFTSGILRPA